MESKSRVFSFKLLSPERCRQLLDDGNGAQWKAPRDNQALSATTLLELDHPNGLARARRALETTLQRLTHDENGEPRLAISSLSMIRYGPGNSWAAHRNEAPLAEPRYGVICYLSEGYRGGETAFPGAAVTLRPAVGEAIVYPWTYEHEAQEVTEGEKVVLECALCEVTVLQLSEPLAVNG